METVTRNWHPNYYDIIQRTSWFLQKNLQNVYLLDSDDSDKLLRKFMNLIDNKWYYHQKSTSLKPESIHILVPLISTSFITGFWNRISRCGLRSKLDLHKRVLHLSLVAPTCYNKLSEPDHTRIVLLGLSVWTRPYDLADNPFRLENG